MLRLTAILVASTLVIPLHAADGGATPTLRAPASDPWYDRSGKAEALADLANGRPVKLYTHVFGGERGGSKTPGLLYCDPDQNIGSKAALDLFVYILEANMSEGVIYTLDQQAKQHSALSFARPYNLTMYKFKRKHVRRLCPKVELEKQ